MDIFSRTASSVDQVGESVAEQAKVYEQLLGLRICVQKTLDEANKFPVSTYSEGYSADVSEEVDYASIRSGLQTSLIALCDYLGNEVPDAGMEPDKEYAEKRRKPSCDNDDASDDEDSTTDVEWEAVLAPQLALRPQWEAAVNKQYSRLHYGSEKTHSRMKVFNQTVWEQVKTSMQDPDKAAEKSLSLLGQSARLGRPDAALPADQVPKADDGSDSDGSDSDGEPAPVHKAQAQYDEEVYDDRGFYSLLLRAFIAAGSRGSGLKADDLAQLRKYRRNQQEVDRRASKGRKTRYVVHKKLQNFMFPHEAPDPTLDVDRLLLSLFQ